MKVKLTKIKSLLEGKHPNNIEEGTIRIGHPQGELTIGKPYIIATMSSWFTTSNIVEIMNENTFRTCNSIYKIEEI